MLFLDKPVDFQPRFEVVSCFVEHDGKILLLHRQNHKPQGGTWSLPGGKVEEGEDISGALARELEEEVDLRITRSELRHLKKVYVRHYGYDFPYYMHKAVFSHSPVIRLSTEEHKDFRWVTPQDALSLNLMDDEGDCIQMIYLD